MPPEQQKFNNPVSQIPPLEPTVVVEHKSRLLLRVSVFIGLILIVLIATGTFLYFKETRDIAKLEITGSAEYKQYIESIDKFNEEWGKTKTQMEAEGSSAEDIALAQRDFFEFVGSTILLKIQLGDTNLTDDEKKGVILKLAGWVKNNPSIVDVDSICEYTEKELPLQDFFVGATLKFKKPMVYLDWKEEQEKYCSPSFAAAKYYSLESASQWDSTIFDKEGRGIKDYKIDPSVTFTVEGRIKLHSRSLFSEGDNDHYILRDSNGVISVVPFFYIFDQDYKGDTAGDGEIGSELYKDGKLVGHIVSDISSRGVWIQGGQVPQEVIDANTPKRPTTFETPLAKRDEFIRRVMFALEEGKIVNYTSKELIDNDLAKDLYTYKNGEVIHNYGGKVYMKKVGNMFSLVFEKIPKGEDCYYFYWMNDPNIWGFEETYIDGVLETYNLAGSKNWNPIYEAFKQKVCYSGKESMTIEFRGDVNEIKKEAGYRKKSEMPKY